MVLQNDAKNIREVRIQRLFNHKLNARFKFWSSAQETITLHVLLFSSVRTFSRHLQGFHKVARLWQRKHYRPTQPKNPEKQ